MTAILRLLTFIEENWSSIVAIVTIAFGIYWKAKKEIVTWKAKSEEEKEAELQAIQDKAIEEARATLGSFILSWCATAELDWNDVGSKIGPVKRADVIRKAYEQFPILSSVADQAELIDFIDRQISIALETVRKTVRVQTTETAE